MSYDELRCLTSSGRCEKKEISRNVIEHAVFSNGLYGGAVVNLAA